MILKKRLNTFKSEGGRLRKVSDELLIDVLRAYEGWTGTYDEFSRELGIHRNALRRLLGVAKEVCQNGHHPESSEFREVKVDMTSSVSAGGDPCGFIELSWDQGKVIRFPEVSQLILFLKQVA
jgi:hypothetical protein